MFYAVYKGNIPGVFDNWNDTQLSINGYKGAIFKKFKIKEDAIYFSKYGKNINEQIKLDKYFTVESTPVIQNKTDNFEIDTNPKVYWDDFRYKNKKCLVAFTDGSFKVHKTKNGHKIPQGGIGIYYPQELTEDVSDIFNIEPITNQRSELYAIYLAITQLSKLYSESEHIIKIYSDSEYSIKCVTQWIKKWKKNNWKTSKGEIVKNLDIIKPIDELYTHYNVDFTHVYSHTNKQDIQSLCNEKADILATDGRKKN
jgi:ribonuclease HI